MFMTCRIVVSESPELGEGEIRVTDVRVVVKSFMWTSYWMLGSITSQLEEIVNLDTKLSSELMMEWLFRLAVGRVLRLRRNTHSQGRASFDSLLPHAGFGHLGKE